MNLPATDWDNMCEQTGRLQCIRDIPDGDFHNPFVIGTPEHRGYDAEMNRALNLEHQQTCAAGKVGQ